MADPTEQEEPHLDYQVLSDLNREPLTLIQQGVVVGTLISTALMSLLCFLGIIILYRGSHDLAGLGGILSIIGSFFLGAYLRYHRFAVHGFYTVAFYVLFTLQIVFLVSIAQGIK